PRFSATSLQSSSDLSSGGPLSAGRNDTRVRSLGLMRNRDLAVKEYEIRPGKKEDVPACGLVQSIISVIPQPNKKGTLRPPPWHRASPRAPDSGEYGLPSG